MGNYVAGGVPERLVPRTTEARNAGEASIVAGRRRGPSVAFWGMAMLVAAEVTLFGTFIDGLGLPAEDYPNLHAWYARCKSRPAVAKQPWFEAFAGEKTNVDQRLLSKSAA